jgi:DNA-binding beta-propeller fold protein YncE
MKRISLCQAIGLLAIGCAMTLPTWAQDAPEQWRLSGFAAPESVSYDPGTGTLFVSNLAVDMSRPRPPAGEAAPAAAPAPAPAAPEAPQGYIAQVALDGTILNKRFVDGLAAPGGNTVVDGTLWQLAGNLLKIDIATATVTETFTRPADVTGLLPDVAVAEDGRAFVTAMSGAIYVTEGGTLVPWLEDASLAGSNGIVIDGNTMYVAAGTMIKSIDIATKEISDYGAAVTLESLDDLRMIPGGMLASSGGKVVEVTEQGEVSEPFAADGVAGLSYIADQNAVVITRLAGGEVAAFRVDF